MSKEDVKKLCAEAAKSKDSGDALRFSQAAQNIANAMCAANTARQTETVFATDDEVKHMVDRFLMWKLPQNFNPDNGISFDPVMNKGHQFESLREPVGTNLFDATQADAMVRYMIEGL